MMVVDAMDLQANHIIHSKLDPHNRPQESEDHRRRGCSRGPFSAGDLLVMGVEIQADLSLDHGIHEHPHDCQHGQGRNPFGFLQPPWGDSCGILAPANAGCHRDLLFLIGLEYLGICTHVWRHCGRQDGPSMRVLGRNQPLWGYGKPIADLDLRCLGLRRAASLCSFFRDLDGFDPIVQDRVAPRAWAPPPPPLATAFVFCYGCLRGSGTGKPPCFHMLDVLGDTLGLLGLRCGIRHSSLGGPLAGVHDQKAERGHVEAPVRLLHGHQAGDTLPMPAPWRLLPCPAWLLE